jgi:hypothetical protein
MCANRDPANMHFVKAPQVILIHFHGHCLKKGIFFNVG